MELTGDSAAEVDRDGLYSDRHLDGHEGQAVPVDGAPVAGDDIHLDVLRNAHILL